MPSYRGASIFGGQVEMVTTLNPTAVQENAFFGVSGVESLNGGSRGRITLVRGVLRYPDSTTLGAAMRAAQALDDGRVGDLIDNYGFTWKNVRLARWVPTGRVRLDPLRGYVQSYQAEFRHLT